MIGFYNYTVILTYLGMLSGFAGITCAFKGNLRFALICMVISGICDMFDGKIAATMERNGQEKRFGIQIDSLSDLICFGVLPAMFVYANGGGKLSWLLSALYLLCALIRLAWFNVEEEERQDQEGGRRKVYLGLPVTTAAVIFPLLFDFGWKYNWPLKFLAPVVLLLTATAFLTPFRFRKPALPVKHEGFLSNLDEQETDRLAEGKMKKDNGSTIRFLYGTVLGRGLLKLILRIHADRLIVRYLRSGWSRLFLIRYAKRHGISMEMEELQKYRSFRDFFVRERGYTEADITPEHLISPCDGWLSAYPIVDNSSFAIKHSRYQVGDLLKDEELAERYQNGICLVFRLCASDNHHYSYIDDGYQGQNNYIEGQLHSVQPIACKTYPVFILNRRSWCLLATENFGPVIQTEIGALIVGQIVNRVGGCRFCRGQEKGHFELAGSTIVLLFEQGRIQLLPELAQKIKKEGEVRVEQGMWIASRCGRRTVS